MSSLRGLPPLNALLSFEVTARLGSVRRAAEELCVTPGATSRQLRLLEQHVGVRLFVPDGRGITLSGPGAEYYAEIRPHFEGLRRAAERLHAGAGKVVVNIWSYTTFATRWLIPRLSQFQATHPKIEVRLSMASEAEPLGTFDAAIRLGDGEWADHEASALIPNIILPVCSPALIERSPIRTVHDLKGHTLLFTKHRPDDWRLWFRAAGEGVQEACNMKKFESSALAYQAAIDGLGVAVAQQELVREDISLGRLLAPLEITYDRGRHTYYLVSHISSGKRKAVDLLRTWLTFK